MSDRDGSTAPHDGLVHADCTCVHVDPAALHAQVERVLQAHGLSSSLAATHPHLFSALPVFVPPAHLARVAEVVAAVDRVTALPAWRDAMLAWAPPVAAHDAGPPGGLLGLDFHLAADGPQLIEVNTNPGGVLLNALAAGAQDCCLPGLVPDPRMQRIEAEVLGVLRAEWRAQRGDAPLARVAIVDEDPPAQYLYPEFLLFRHLLAGDGLDAVICDPSELEHRQARLWARGEPVDFVYNRLTDFALEQPGHAALRAAWLAGDVVLSPHPRAHALLADKRGLVLLGDADFLRGAGAHADDIAVLRAAVPETRLVGADNRDALWAGRRHWFFKPATGFGSRAGYRGDKLTRRAWEAIGAGTYVAQRLVPPSTRALPGGGGSLKVDIRCYAYAGRPLLYAARMYQGQTTNFRTPGGGFAPVLSTPALASPAAAPTCGAPARGAAA